MRGGHSFQCIPSVRMWTAFIGIPFTAPGSGRHNVTSVELLDASLGVAERVTGSSRSTTRRGLMLRERAT